MTFGTTSGRPPSGVYRHTGPDGRIAPYLSGVRNASETDKADKPDGARLENERWWMAAETFRAARSTAGKRVAA